MEAGTDRKRKLYQGVVWPDADKPGLRISFMACDAEDAERHMREEYGEGVQYTVHNKEDADRPR